MKITINQFSPTKVEREFRDGIEINVDEDILCFYDGEAEDATLRRDFNDVYKFGRLLEKAFNAGKNGDTLEVERLETL